MYKAIAKGYNELYMEEQRNKFRRIKNISGLILDIGSGTGIACEFFKNVVQLDPSIEMLKESKGLRVCGKAEYLPFKDKVFDSVISITALHHTDIKKVVKEIKRVAKEDAKFAFSIMKRAKHFSEIREYLNKNFKLEEIDEDKDLILVSE